MIYDLRPIWLPATLALTFGAAQAFSQQWGVLAWGVAGGVVGFLMAQERPRP